MRKVQDILKLAEEFTMDEFWVVIDALPDTGDGKKHKDNVNAYIKKDGTPKAKALAPRTQKDYQALYDTESFINMYVADQMHLNKLRHHVSVHKQHVKDIKAGKTEPMKVVKYGQLVEFKKDKTASDEPKESKDD